MVYYICLFFYSNEEKLNFFGMQWGYIASSKFKLRKNVLKKMEYAKDM